LVILKFNDLKNKLNINLPEGKYEVMHKTMNSEEIRAGIYFCSLTLIKDSWLFGHGIGDVNDKLNECYKEKIKSDVYQTFYYNSHNQYIQAFLVGGIFSFLFFLLSLIYLLKTAILKNDKSFIFFIVLIICCFFTENILSRHDGVLFFSFFSSIFYFKKTV
jgi:O-antigen ligase